MSYTNELRALKFTKQNCELHCSSDFLREFPKYNADVPTFQSFGTVRETNLKCRTCVFVKVLVPKTKNYDNFYRNCTLYSPLCVKYQ